jgi:hypothetical protein
MYAVALSVLTTRLVQQKLSAFCEKRVPHHVRDEVRLAFVINGNNATLNEERVGETSTGAWTSQPISQFRFDPDSTCWTLYFADRNSKWHRYEPAKPNRDVEQLIGVVDADLSGVFWG